ncbi:MAG: hypothetical protein ABIB47_03055 [Candidatus Woesearchaeota archaeon]
MPAIGAQDIYGGLFTPLGLTVQRIIEALPWIIFAIVVLIIGIFVAVILGHALRIILDKFKIDAWIRKAHLTKAVGHTDVPALFGELLKWWIIIIFLEQAVALLNLGALSETLSRFVGWLPNLLVAVVIFLVGLAAAHYVEIRINEHTRLKGMRMAAKILKWIVVVLVAIQALDIIRVDVGLFKTVFIVLIGALAAGIALALGIGLGLGLRKQSEGLIKDLKKNL